MSSTIANITDAKDNLNSYALSAAPDNYSTGQYIWCSLEQTRATRAYIVSDEYYYPDSSTILYDWMEYKDYRNNVEIIERAHQILNDGIVDLDPDIRKIVRKNFSKLLWK